MEVEPAATPVASPLVEIVATAGVDESHVDCAVTSLVELSEYVAVTVYCWVPPGRILALDGVTVTLDGCVPVPLTEMLCVEPAPFKSSVSTIESDVLTAKSGSKTTLMVQ